MVQCWQEIISQFANFSALSNVPQVIFVMDGSQKYKNPAQCTLGAMFTARNTRVGN